MKSKNIFLLIGVITSISLLSSGFLKSRFVSASERDLLFNNGWKFIRDSIAGAEKPDFDDSKWMVVDLPHDYSLLGYAACNRAEDRWLLKDLKLCLMRLSSILFEN